MGGGVNAGHENGVDAPLDRLVDGPGPGDLGSEFVRRDLEAVGDPGGALPEVNIADAEQTNGHAPRVATGAAEGSALD